MRAASIPTFRLDPRESRAGEPFRLRVPYSIGNVGPGFDRFGLCLKAPVDTVELHPAQRYGFELRGDEAVPSDPSANSAWVAFRAVLGAGESGRPVRLTLTKGFRAGTGLGSSGASSAAGALAAALHLGLDLEETAVRARIVAGAVEGERAATGTGHYDNVLASLFGGFLFLESIAPLRIRRWDPTLPAALVLAVPDSPLPTRRSRAVLPASVPHGDAVENLARAVGLVQALLDGDPAGFGANLSDRLAEPYRAVLVPGFAAARQAGLAAGAFGVAMAGSGPAIFALAPERWARRVARGFIEGFARGGTRSEAFVTGIGTGPCLLDGSLRTAPGAERSGALGPVGL
ncbi:MAG: homoserine kinase [Thermoplasmata archaeon]